VILQAIPAVLGTIFGTVFILGYVFLGLFSAIIIKNGEPSRTEPLFPDPEGPLPRTDFHSKEGSFGFHPTTDLSYKYLMLFV
jgi:hypothetical protein